MPSKRVSFENGSGIRLAGIIDWPDESPREFAVFSHCFTCTKDLKAIVRISRGLARRGIAVLRFDFTGLGESGGNFSDTNFDSNILDLRSAVDFLASGHRAPSLFIGHSLGGAAMMRSITEFDSVAALVTIASPSSTHHLADYLSRTNPDIEGAGQGEVTIGGRTYTLKKQLIENLRAHNLEESIARIHVPHMIIHPPEDDTLPYWHAEKLFELTGGVKSMLTLDGSDHLLVDQPVDVEYVATMIDTWFSRQKELAG
ncbi:MAG: alpha/beta hydrolase [Planctomycetota bacterium]